MGVNLKHELQDYLREWEKHYPERVEFVIRLAFCLVSGLLGGAVVGLLLWSAQIGFGIFTALAVILMWYLPE